LPPEEGNPSMSAARENQLIANSESHRRAGESRIETADSAWKSLYRVGGGADLAVLVFIPIQMIVFFIWPPPSTVTGWFTLFQGNALVGLLDMDLLLIVDYVLSGLVFLALYAALRRASESLMAIALTLQLVGITTYFASTTAFEMLSLSSQFAMATTDAERSTLLAAGQAMLAIWQGTAFDVSYILGAVAQLIVSAVMLRTGIFGTAAAYAGLLSGAAMLVPPTAGTVGLVLSLVSLVPLVAWLILVARRLLRLG